MKHKQKENLKKILEKIYSYKLEREDGKDHSVGLIIRNGDHSPTSSAFIRLLSPLLDGSVKDRFALKIFSAQNLPTQINEDFAIVQRTAFDNIHQAEKFIESCRSDTKIIVDNDDAFHEINKDHPEYYQQIRRTEAIEYLMGVALQIWVSTDRLIIKKYANKTSIIPNTLDRKLWQNGKLSQSANGPIKMVYMGTATHDVDFELILPALDELAKEYPGSFSLTVIGVSQNLPDRAWVTQLTTPRFGSLYPTFVGWFIKQGPFDIGLSPLVDSAFNRSKSDIKCLDYLAAGIIPVVSNLKPYQSKEIEDFIIKINNSEEAWFEKLSGIIADPAKFRLQKQKTISAAQKYLWKYRSSEITAKKLLDNIENLAKKS